MNGYDEAAAWLAQNAPDWRIQWAESRLEHGSFLGSPTEQRVEVLLVQAFPTPLKVELRGEGRTHLEAVQSAVGAIQGKSA